MAETPNIDFIKDWLDQLPEERIERQLDEVNKQMSALAAKANAFREALELKKRFREFYGPQIERDESATSSTPTPAGINATSTVSGTVRAHNGSRPAMRKAVLEIMADPSQDEWPVPELQAELIRREWLDNTSQALRSLGAALSRMTTEGEVDRVRRGVYKLPKSASELAADLAASPSLLDLGGDDSA